MLDIDIEKNAYAIAITENEKDPFFSKSTIFSLCFPGIEKKSQLISLISKKGDGRIVLDKKIVFFNEMSWELFILNDIGNVDIYLLKDVTSEFQVLKRLKENIIPLKEENRLFNEIFKQYIPIGIMVIDEEYNIQFVNNFLSDLFIIPKIAKLKKCYNYRKRISPCPECILVNFKSDNTKNILSIKTNDKLITNRIFQINEKYLLLYSDTTKEIKLINEIKKQQLELRNANIKIAEQNDILKRLSDINIQIGVIKDIEKILKKITDSIIETVHCEKGAIILRNEKNNIEYAFFSSKIGKKEQNNLIGCIKKEKSLLDLYVVLQIKNKGEVTGEIFLYNPQKVLDQSILDLFLAQVSIYLENVKLQKRLEEVAQIDGLTGVFNRYYLDKKLEEEKRLSEKFTQPLSLILVDVNGLKEANDQLGHEAGDLLIKETASLLKSNISLYDSVFRLGGDEFVILLINCPVFHLKIMIKMFKDLQKNRFIYLNKNKMSLHFSIGGACSTEFPVDDLKVQADREMYLNKEEFYAERNKYR